MDAHENAAVDVEELLSLYEESGEVTLAPFKRQWRSRAFSFIHEGCTKRNRYQEFVQVLYSTCLARLRPEVSVSALAGAIFCMYCLFRTQTGTTKILVYLSLEDTRSLVAAVGELRAHRAVEAVAVVHRMMREHAFVFGAVSTNATVHRGELAARADEAQRRNKVMRQTLLGSAPAELLLALQEEDSIEKFEEWAQRFLETPAYRAPVSAILKELEATGPTVRKLNRESHSNKPDKQKTGDTGAAPRGPSAPGGSSLPAAAPPARPGSVDEWGNEEDPGLEKEELDEWDEFFNNELEKVEEEEDEEDSSQGGGTRGR